MCPQFYAGQGIKQESCVTNWIALDSWIRLLNMLPIEGEAELTPALQATFVGACDSLSKFLHNGFRPSGVSLEGLGKNEMAITSLIALAKRGYDFLGHKHLKVYILGF